MSVSWGGIFSDYIFSLTVSRHYGKLTYAINKNTARLHLGTGSTSLNLILVVAVMQATGTCRSSLLFLRTSEE